MPRFAAADGTRLSYRCVGDGHPLICLPGGPGRAARYLGDLGGLSDDRMLVMLDLRGTGDSDEPTDPSSLRFDRLAADVDALRSHLGVACVDVLGHSAGAGVALQFAIDHPRRCRRLVLLTPSLRSVDLRPTDAEFNAKLAQQRARECFAGVVDEGHTTDSGRHDSRAFAPLLYGTWSAAAQAHAAAEVGEHSEAAAAGFYAGEAIDALTMRAAIGRIASPVLIYSGEYDAVSPPSRCEQLARFLLHAQHVTQRGGGHFPWLDDPAAVATRVAMFLG